MASDGEWALVGTQGVPTGRRRPGLLFAPLRERFRCRGTSVLCFVLARAPHALGHGTVRCRAGARRRWSCGVRGPGSGGHGWRALGCTQCLVGLGEGAAASRPALQGFRRTRRQRVGVRGGGSMVGGRMLAGRWWWALGCTLLLAARAEYGMRVAWARVEGVTLQGFEDWTVRCRIWAGVPRSLSLTLSLSLSLSLACSLALSRSLSLSLPGLSGMVRVSDVPHERIVTHLHTFHAVVDAGCRDAPP